MALFPIHSNFERDFVVQLVPVDTDNTMDEVAAACAHHSVGRRVPTSAVEGKVLRVRCHDSGELFPRDMTIAESGIRPTECLDILIMDE